MDVKPWTVVDQTERTGPLVNGTFGKVVRVTFRTANGVTRSIDVAERDYNADTVRDLIDAEVAKINAIDSL